MPLSPATKRQRRAERARKEWEKIANRQREVSSSSDDSHLDTRGSGLNESLSVEEGSCFSDEIGNEFGNSSDVDYVSSTSSDGNIEEASFVEKLRNWAIEDVSFSKVNELLKILKSSGHEVPADYRSLIGTPRTSKIVSFPSGGEFVYFGLK